MSLAGPRTVYEWRAFSIAGIPVTFSAWFLLPVGIVVLRAGSPALATLHLVALTIGVLVHELGHALVARQYRLEPEILLHGFGGWCAHTEPHTANEALRVTAAGPAAGLGLALLSAGAYWSSAHPSWWLDVLLWDLAWTSLLWNLVNLLPIRPLDGGTLLLNGLERRKTLARPLRTSRVIGVIVAIVAMVIGLWFRRTTIVMLVGWVGYLQAVELGWLPAFSSSSRSTYLARGTTGGRRGWWPTGPLASLLAVVSAPAVLRAFAPNGSTLRVLAIEPQTLPPELWRLVTWPIVPAGAPVVLAASLVGMWFAAARLERATETWHVVRLTIAATIGAGLVGWFTGAVSSSHGTVAGPTPLALAILAGWAITEQVTVRVHPLVVLLVSVLAALAVRWFDADPEGAAADVGGLAVGIAFGWHRAGLRDRAREWWALRDPAAIPIDQLPR